MFNIQAQKSYKRNHLDYRNVSFYQRFKLFYKLQNKSLIPNLICLVFFFIFFFFHLFFFFFFFFFDRLLLPFTDPMFLHNNLKNIYTMNLFKLNTSD